MTSILDSAPSPREALPMLMELVMRVTLKHYAARCLSCSQVFIFPVDNIQTVLDHRSPMFIHASTCSALHGIPMAEMLMRIRKYAANEDVEARSLALMDHLWRYFGEFTSGWPRWFVTATGEGEIQLEMDFKVLLRSVEVIVRLDGGFVVYNYIDDGMKQIEVSTVEEVMDVIRHPFS